VGVFESGLGLCREGAGCSTVILLSLPRTPDKFFNITNPNQPTPINPTRVKTVNPRIKVLMWIVFTLMGIVAVLATAGSLESIVHTASSFALFGARR